MNLRRNEKINNYQIFRKILIHTRNPEIMASEEKSEKTKVIAKEKRGFYIHFIIYILVNILLFAQWWYITGGEGFAWPITTTAGWGIGIAAHFIVVFIIGVK